MKRITRVTFLLINATFPLVAVLMYCAFVGWEGHTFDYSKHYAVQDALNAFLITNVVSTAFWFVVLELMGVFDENS